jgi:hypothetical protein
MSCSVYSEHPKVCCAQFRRSLQNCKDAAFAQVLPAAVVVVDQLTKRLIVNDVNAFFVQRLQLRFAVGNPELCLGWSDTYRVLLL